MLLLSIRTCAQKFSHRLAKSEQMLVGSLELEPEKKSIYSRAGLLCQMYRMRLIPRS